MGLWERNWILVVGLIVLCSFGGECIILKGGIEKVLCLLLGLVWMERN